jgi:hypothetical protein
MLKVQSQQKIQERTGAFSICAVFAGEKYLFGLEEVPKTFTIGVAASTGERFSLSPLTRGVPSMFQTDSIDGTNQFKRFKGHRKQGIFR